MLLKKYTAPAYLTRLGILSVDIFLCIISILLASLLRFNFEFSELVSLFPLAFALVLVIRIVSFRWFRTYAVIVRYTGISDLIQVLAVVAGGSILLMSLSILMKPYGLFLPVSILAIDFFLLMVLMAAFRIAMPGLYHLLYNKNTTTKVNVLMIGAGRLGSMTRNAIRQDSKSNFSIVASMDDNPDLRKKSLDGVPIYSPDEITDIIKKEDIQKAIFAIQDISNRRKNELVDLCLAQDVQVLQVPFQANWSEADFQVNQIKEIQIEDLLERSSIVLDKDNTRKAFYDKRILVTGGAGSIGSELVRQLVKFDPKQILIVDQAETPLVNIDLEIKEAFGYQKVRPIIADIVDYSRIENVFEKFRPHVVFHAAAYKHVPIMEAYPREAINVNVQGTKNLSELADIYGCEKFVMVSTDKAVNPTNIMGATKRIAEMFVQALNKKSKTQFITTRFGNVLGSNGSVIPRFRKQIQKGGPVTVTDPEITRYFMTIPEAAQLVLEAGAMGEGGEIFLFDMGEPVKILHVAEKLIRLSGLKPYDDIDIVFSGLRPGEKLYEELLTTSENCIETHHPKITIARIQEHDFIVIDKEISDLIGHLADNDNDIDLVRQMKHIVPDFRSQNSVFSRLDKAQALDS